MTTASRVRAALLATVLLWASAFVAIRHAAPSYPPGAFVLLRFLIPAILLGTVTAARRTLVPPRRDIGALVLLGLAFAAYLLLLVEGEKTVDAGTASMLAEASPILTALLAAVVLSEPMTRWLVVGLLVGFAGAALIAVGEGGGLRADRGALLILGAATAQAVLLVVQKPLLARQSALAVVTQASVVGAVLLSPFAGSLADALRTAPASATFAVIFLSVTTGAISYVLLAFAVAHTSSTGATSAALYLVPPLAIALGWGLLGETPAFLSVVGGALAVAGVVIAQRRP